MHYFYNEVTIKFLLQNKWYGGNSIQSSLGTSVHGSKVLHLQEVQWFQQNHLSDHIPFQRMYNHLYDLQWPEENLPYDHPENNLYYVFKVVRFFPIIFDFIKGFMNNREVSIYIEKSSIMKKRMEEYLTSVASPLVTTKYVTDWFFLVNSMDCS